MQIHQNLSAAYDTQYASGATAWRETGAKYKVKHIEEVTASKHFKHILEVGAGDGAVLAHLEKAKIADKLSAVEISAEGIAHIRQRKLTTLQDLQLFDGYVLAYPDAEFEAVVCTHVIEHVEHPRLLLREIKRVSQYQIFEIPIDFSWKIDQKTDHFLGYGHINIYTPALFRFLLLSEGFEILHELHTISAPELWRMEARIQKQKMPALAYQKWYAMNYLKRTLWHLKPAFSRKRNPDAYTVFCKASEKEIKIF